MVCITPSSYAIEGKESDHGPQRTDDSPLTIAYLPPATRHPLPPAPQSRIIPPGMDWLLLIPLGVATFAATNTDDALLLLAFFGDRRFRARHVFIGQALGIGLLVLLSLAGAALALALPERWIGLLGLLPIALGLRELIARRRGHDDDEPAKLETEVTRITPGWRRVAAVAGVALAGGGDNIGVYVPLFAARPPAQVALLVAVFAIMLAVWLFGAFYVARRSIVASRIQMVGQRIFPFVLIGLGVILLAESILS